MGKPAPIDSSRFLLPFMFGRLAVDELATRKDRLKTTNTFTVLQERPVEADTPILRDGSSNT
ncbi:hypothetical protein [Cohnella massiliensis]|uniref:hypothetical protein n=1 Tax=Cohnella massiliensis TaxID=1816691 RepID=UPI0009BBE03B|nr:hypothetical protein [Cohnella massiliensis]